MQRDAPTLDLAFPLGGKSEGFTLEGQEPLTSPYALNMRALDPRSRRLRGAKRCGTSRWNPNAIGGFSPAKRIQRGTTLVHQNKLSDYTETASGSEVVKWTTQITENQSDPILACRMDWQGNGYFLQGSGILTKLNSEGKKIWDFKVPVKDPEHVTRALEVDEIFGFVYVGASAGGDQKKAQVFAIQEKMSEDFEEEPEPEVLWDMELKLYVERIRSRGPYLILGCNDKKDKRSWVLTFLGKDTEDPLEKQRFEVSYPLFGMDAKLNGEVFTTSPQRNNRWNSVYGDGAKVGIVAGEPDSFITDWGDRVWGWWRSDNIDGQNNTTLQDGDDVDLFFDVSGHSRHFIRDGNAAVPTFRKSGFNGLPSISFVTDHTVGPDRQRLISGSNWSVVRQQADHQRTALPGYTGHNFAMFMVFRPVQEGTVNADVGVVFAQDTSHGTTGVRAIAVNQGDAVYPTVGAGFGRIVEPAVAPSGGSAGLGNTWTNFFSFQNPQRIVILSWIMSSGAGPWPSGSRIRVNGTVIDDYEAVALTSSGIAQSTILGGEGVPGVGINQPYNGEILELIVLREDAASTPALPKVTDGEIEGIEGYLAWKYGVAARLPGSHTYALTEGPPNGEIGAGPNTVWGDIFTQGQQLVKWSPTGKPIWVVSDSASNEAGGIGYDVRIFEQKGKPTKICTVGSKVSLADPNSLHAQQWTDEGAATPTVVAGQILDAADWAYTHLQVDYDGFGAAHIPLAFASALSNIFSVFVPAVGPPSHTVNDLPDKPSTAVNPQVYCVAAGPRTEYYDQDIKFNEWLVCGDEVCRAHRVDYVTSEPILSGSPRQFVDLVVVGGEVRRVTTSTDNAISGAPTFDADVAPFWDVALIGNEAVFSNGDQYKIYNPVRDPYWLPGEGLVTNGRIQNFVAKRGEIPKRHALLFSYRGRLGVARGAQDPSSWAVSRQYNHFDWEFDPYLKDGTEAVASFNSLANQVPDIINGVVPIGDDQLIFGGDRELWLLDGDPAQGGIVVQMNRTQGMAFGKAWCLGPRDVVYYFGSRGGLYAIQGGVSVPLSDENMPSELRSVDLSTFRMHLEWNDELQCVHIYAIPYSESAVVSPAWCWEPRTNAFWPDTWARTAIQPTCAWVRDGDAPNDRRLMIGCQDGRIRYVDPSADTDDHNGAPAAIQGVVRFGPIIMPRGLGQKAPRELVLRHLDMISALYGPCQYRVFATDHPEDLGQPIDMGKLASGRARRENLSASGRYIYIDVLAAGTAAGSSHWAFEAATIGFVAGGLA